MFPGRGGAGRVSVVNRGILGGGGAKYFFSGPKRPPREGRRNSWVIKFQGGGLGCRLVFL